MVQPDWSDIRLFQRRLCPRVIFFIKVKLLYFVLFQSKTKHEKAFQTILLNILRHSIYLFINLDRSAAPMEETESSNESWYEMRTSATDWLATRFLGGGEVEPALGFIHERLDCSHNTFVICIVYGTPRQCCRCACASQLYT